MHKHDFRLGSLRMICAICDEELDVKALIAQLDWCDFERFKKVEAENAMLREVLRIIAKTSYTKAGEIARKALEGGDDAE